MSSAAIYSNRLVARFLKLAVFVQTYPRHTLFLLTFFHAHVKGVENSNGPLYLSRLKCKRAIKSVPTYPTLCKGHSEGLKGKTNPAQIELPSPRADVRKQGFNIRSPSICPETNGDATVREAKINENVSLLLHTKQKKY